MVQNTVTNTVNNIKEIINELNDIRLYVAEINNAGQLY